MLLRGFAPFFCLIDLQGTNDIPHTTAIERHADDLLFHGRHQHLWNTSRFSSVAAWGSRRLVNARESWCPLFSFGGGLWSWLDR
jgi:hypothetical protein